MDGAKENDVLDCIFILRNGTTIVLKKYLQVKSYNE